VRHSFFAADPGVAEIKALLELPKAISSRREE
jgi:hypothetical protein